MTSAHPPHDTIDDLLAIMRRLRDPVDGCPWDVAQDFASIVPYTIEEAYEVADAVERQNMDDLCDELGDLLLQVVFHAQMAAERGAFGFEDVVRAICAKMVRRHPHVFGSLSARGAQGAKASWDAIKADEKRSKALHAAEANNGLLDDVPHAMPAVTVALKLQAKASKVGFDWGSPEPVFGKIEEELGELRAALDAGHAAEARGELGDVLFSVANLARLMDADPESALRATNAKFRRRFGFIEQQIASAGRTLGEASLEEMEALWTVAKQAEQP